MNEENAVKTVKINQSYNVVFTIVTRGKGDEVIEINKHNGAFINMLCLGRGTAPSSILEMFGLGAEEKDIVLTVISGELTHELIKTLSAEFDFEKPGHGICFSVPIQSIPIQSFSGLRVRKYLANASFKEEHSNGK